MTTQSILSSGEMFLIVFVITAIPITISSLCLYNSCDTGFWKGINITNICIFSLAFIISLASLDIALIVLFILIILFIIVAIPVQIHIYKNNKEYYSQDNLYFDNLFEPKNLLTNCENKFYDQLLIAFKDLCLVQCQVGLATIINVNDENYFRWNSNKLHKYIDFGLFNKKTKKPIIMIELNDKTHAERTRYTRDLFVREVLEKAKIPLITFYTNYPNKAWYIKKRIIEKLKENK